MLDSLDGFEWDTHNIEHIALHGVSPLEVEQAARQRHVIIPAAPKEHEMRWKLFGMSTAGRFLVVVFAIRHNRMRTVTAYPMNQAERKLYATEIDN